MHTLKCRYPAVFYAAFRFLEKLYLGRNLRTLRSWPIGSLYHPSGFTLQDQRIPFGKINSQWVPC